MGQQPNMPLSLDDLPRSELHPAPARRWRAGRPGDLSAPAEVPWGGAFGTPGPDTGYALRLLQDRDAGGADRQALATVMGARASRLGRAPVAADAEAAAITLALAAASPAHAAGAAGRGAEATRRLLESLDESLLAAPLDDLRRRRPGGVG
jgi:hypothetical protein